MEVYKLELKYYYGVGVVVWVCYTYMYATFVILESCRLVDLSSFWV